MSKEFSDEDIEVIRKVAETVCLELSGALAAVANHTVNAHECAKLWREVYVANLYNGITPDSAAIKADTAVDLFNRKFGGK